MAEPTYHASTWSGLPYYQCLLCPATDFDLERLTLHLQDSHAVLPVQAIDEVLQGVAMLVINEVAVTAEGTLV
jgi:hypothetical protein